MTEHEASARPRSLADKLSYLVETVHPAGRGPYTLEEMVMGIRDLGGSVSRANINALRLGRGTNPSKSTMEDIARFFGVPVAYLHDDPHGEISAEEHELLLVIRRAEMEELVRAIAKLQPQTRASLQRVVTDLREMHVSEQPDHPA